MRDPDQQFFDSFMLVVGILIGVTVGLFFLVRAIAFDTQGQYVLADPTVQEEIEKRIAPVGLLMLAGSDELAAAAVAPMPTPEPVDEVLTGPQVYNQACIACHGTGIGGAPMTGDAAAWEARVAQGREILIDHAIKGFQGETGVMPEKGGQLQLSDDEVIAAVEYMLEQQ